MATISDLAYSTGKGHCIMNFQLQDIRPDLFPGRQTGPQSPAGLHILAERVRIKIMQCLIFENDIDVNGRDSKGFTALFFAALKSRA